MSVSSIDTTSVNTSALVSASAATSTVAPVERHKAERHGHHHHEHHGGRGEFMGAVMQALGDSGLTLPTRQGRHHGDDDGEEHGSGRNGESMTRTIRHDLNRLMHDLFAAVRQGQNTTGSSTTDATASASTTTPAAASDSAATTTTTTPVPAKAAPKSRYDDFTTALQNIIQQLGSNSGSGNTALSALKSDFDKLVSDVQKFSGAQSGQGTTININITINNGGSSSGTSATSTTGTTTPAASTGSNASTTGTSGTTGTSASTPTNTSTTSNNSNSTTGSINLQSFLQNLLKHLQGLSASGHSLIGSTIDESA